MKKKIMSFCLIVVISVFSYSSCVTMNIVSMVRSTRPRVNVDGKNVWLNPKDFPSPKDNTLIFFSMDVDFKLWLSSADFIQTNTKYEAIDIGTGKASFFDVIYILPPMPTGRNFDLYKLQTNSSVNNNTIIYYNSSFELGENSNSSMHIKTKKPGLQYLGEYKATTRAIIPTGSENEIKALQVLKDYLVDTEWEALIDKRMKELQE